MNLVFEHVQVKRISESLNGSNCTYKSGGKRTLAWSKTLKLKPWNG